jgi:hypothetical protein
MTADTFLRIMIAVFWVSSLLLVAFIIYKFQKKQAQLDEAELKAVDDEIDKALDQDTLDELIDLNNKHKGDS